jgi:4a-hydroxytetrahydrobiopterin dehydratase
MGKKLSTGELDQELLQLPEWTTDGECLTREFKFRDFVTAMEFVNCLAETAESIQHHPDIDIRFNKVKIGLCTHDVGGVTGKDTQLASIADDLALEIAAKVLS